MNKAYAARLHHAEKHFLLGRRVITPDQRFQQFAGKAAAKVAQLPIAVLAVEYGIDRFERPGLIENDAVLEKSLAVEHDPGIVQVAQQVLGRGDAAGFVAQLAKMILGEGPVLPLSVRNCSIGVAHLFQALLDLEPPDADRDLARLFPE